MDFHALCPPLLLCAAFAAGCDKRAPEFEAAPDLPLTVNTPPPAGHDPRQAPPPPTSDVGVSTPDGSHLGNTNVGRIATTTVNLDPRDGAGAPLAPTAPGTAAAEWPNEVSAELGRIAGQMAQALHQNQDPNSVDSQAPGPTTEAYAALMEKRQLVDQLRAQATRLQGEMTLAKTAADRDRCAAGLKELNQKIRKAEADASAATPEGMSTPSPADTTAFRKAEIDLGAAISAHDPAALLQAARAGAALTKRVDPAMAAMFQQRLLQISGSAAP